MTSQEDTTPPTGQRLLTPADLAALNEALEKRKKRRAQTTKNPPPLWQELIEEEKQVREFLRVKTRHPDMYERTMTELAEYWAQQPRPKPPARAMTWEEREEISDRAMFGGLEAGIAERHFEHTAPAVWARVIEPGQYPRLHLAGGQRAGRVGEARFKGRYHPHLIVDNTKAA
jgi:hypothetical protein